MVWLGIAILSASIHGVVNIIDSHLLSRRMPSLATFLLPVGIIHLTYSSIALAVFPFPEGISGQQMAIAIIAGILRTGAVTIMLYTLTREEVSRVIPVVYTYPIFVAIMAVALLGERLLPLHWLAITIVVAGAVLVSLKRNHSGTGVRLDRSFYLLLASSLLMAGADVAGKHALGYLSWWNLYAVTGLCLSLLFLLMSVRPGVLRQLRGMPRLGSSISLLAFNEVLAPTAIILSFWAIQGGPVSLVSTVISSRPVFVFIYAVILARAYPPFLEWRPTRATLVLRFVATIMVASGTAIIHQLSL